jgi:hypothetical protein
MTKWTKTRRDPDRNYIDEEKIAHKKRMLAKARELLTEAEQEAALRRFRDAVSERERRDQ